MFVLVRASKWSRILEHCQWSLNMGTFKNATWNWRIAFIGLTSQWTLLQHSFLLWGIRILLGSAVPLLPTYQRDDESFVFFMSSYHTGWTPCFGKHRKSLSDCFYCYCLCGFHKCTMSDCFKKIKGFRCYCCLLIWQTQILAYKEKCNTTFQYSEPITWSNMFCLISYLF